MASSVLKCFVDSGMLVTFPGDVTSQSQQDVLISLLYSQLGADKSHQREDDPQSWYSMFDYILQNIGWTISNAEFNVDASKESTFVMASLALNAMANNDKVMISEEEIEVFRKAFNVLHTLPDDDPLVSLFYKSDYDETSKAASLILASIEIAETKEVVLKLVMFGLEKNVEPAPRYLLHVYNSKEVNLDTARTSKMVLNETTFSRVREALIDKLGDRVETMIKEVAILPDK